MSGLTTHALDMSTGRPAAGMTVEVWARLPEGDRLVKRLVTNREGRTDEPCLGPGETAAGRYRLVFRLGDYHRDSSRDPGLFETVPVDFVIEDPREHYHVPLLATPFGYSTYRGS